MRFIGRLIWLFFSLVTIAVAMIFATSNTHQATLYFWPFENGISLPLWSLTLGALVAGAVFGGGLVWFSLIAARARNWRLERQLGKAEKRASMAEEKLTEASIGAPATATPTPTPTQGGHPTAPIAHTSSER